MKARKFLVVVDESPEFRAALAYACGRARSTDGQVCLMRAVPPPELNHWSGVRDEMERELLDEARELLEKTGQGVLEKSGQFPEYLILLAEAKDAIRECIIKDPDIKILVLASAIGGRDPGPLVSALAKDGIFGGVRRVPVTVVPGDLTDQEISDLC